MILSKIQNLLSRFKVGQTQKPHKRPTAVDKYNNHASRVRNPNWAVSPYNRFSNFEAKSEKMEDEDRTNVLLIVEELEENLDLA
ncbi:unnamed protein product, partial [Vitis vinifera]